MSGFLDRWSRRKRGVDDAEPAQPAANPAELQPHAEPPSNAVAAEAAFDPACLPPVESLTADSDLRDFLRPQVPAVLRHAALRRMWTLDPTIAGFVGPADYAWDFNAPETITGFAGRLVGDTGRLLAQAVGSPPRTDAATEPDIPATDEAGPDDAALLAGVSDPEEPPCGAPSTEQAPVEPRVTPELVTQAPDVPARSRSHGGALPT